MRYDLGHKIYLRFPQQREGFPVGENMRRIISISHKMDNSLAFFMIPFFLLAYVAWRPFVFSNLLILSFTLPILPQPSSFFSHSLTIPFYCTFHPLFPIALYQTPLHLIWFATQSINQSIFFPVSKWLFTNQIGWLVRGRTRKENASSLHFRCKKYFSFYYKIDAEMPWMTIDHMLIICGGEWRGVLNHKLWAIRSELFWTTC